MSEYSTHHSPFPAYDTRIGTHNTSILHNVMHGQGEGTDIHNLNDRENKFIISSWIYRLAKEHEMG